MLPPPLWKRNSFYKYFFLYAFIQAWLAKGT